MTTAACGNVLVESLADLGVRFFFTVPGESFLEVLDAAETDPRTRLVSTRHESGASFMAEANAKLTGMPAVAMATRAVGASNLAIGVHTARHDSTPLIALVGQVDQERRGRDGFQEIDLQGFYRPITKWTAALQRPSRARELAYRAVTAATSGRPGPVLIELPADVLAEKTAAGWPGGGQPPRTEIAAPAPGPAVLDEIGARVAAAARPVVIAGLGAQPARDELVRFAATYGTGVYSAFRRQDVFPNDDPRYLGHLTLGTSPAILRALREADLVLILGSRLSEVTAQGYTLPGAAAQVIHVDIEAGSMGAGVIPSLAVVADVRATLAGLLRRPPGRGQDRDWAAAHDAYWSESTIRPAGGTLVNPAEVVAAMTAVLPPDTVIASDAGNFSIFLHRYWRYRAQRSQVAPTSGAMGYAVPAAIGAKLAAPERTVVAVAGDGGFLMTGQELETAVRNGLPLVVIVMRNGMYGTIAMHQVRAFGRTAGTDIGDVDLAGYAASLGAASFRVGDRRDLAPALSAAVAAGRPALVDVQVDPDAITPASKLSELRAG
ncbi:MAG TPA: thiamine pyrophosphate-dependent enzyme [Streptosporangiaceae bacterium]|jgi:acetolactate synthase-1/2/3 large subunit